MNVTKDILDEFKRLTSTDVEAFLTEVLNFFSGDSYTKLVSFYSGQTSNLDRGVLIELDNLDNECQAIFHTFQSMGNRFNNAKWWVLLEVIEQIDSQIKTAQSIDKWCKSSLTLTSYSPTTNIAYNLRKNQTLERVSQDILGNANPQDDWFDIAFQNRLREEDYSVDGGSQITLSTNVMNIGKQINSVVDVMNGDSILGKDFDNDLQFEDDDLKTLTPEDTAFQAVETLALLKMNDHPDYPTEGLQSTILVGSNRALLNFPVIIRQFNETFATDDTLKNFAVNSITNTQDTLSIDFKIETILGEGMDLKVDI